MRSFNPFPFNIYYIIVIFLGSRDDLKGARYLREWEDLRRERVRQHDHVRASVHEIIIKLILFNSFRHCGRCVRAGMCEKDFSHSQCVGLFQAISGLRTLLFHLFLFEFKYLL